MALINCPNCEKEISSNARACPSCGSLVPKKLSTLAPKKMKLSTAILIGVIASFVIIVAIVASDPRAVTDNDWTFYNGKNHVSIGSSRKNIEKMFGQKSMSNTSCSYEYMYAEILGDTVRFMSLNFSDGKHSWHINNGINKNTSEAELVKMYDLKEWDKGEDYYYIYLYDYFYKIYLKKNDKELVRCEESEAEYIMKIAIKDESLAEISLAQAGYGYE